MCAKLAQGVTQEEEEEAAEEALARACWLLECLSAPRLLRLTLILPSPRSLCSVSRSLYIVSRSLCSEQVSNACQPPGY